MLNDLEIALFERQLFDVVLHHLGIHVFVVRHLLAVEVQPLLVYLEVFNAITVLSPLLGHSHDVLFYSGLLLIMY